MKQSWVFVFLILLLSACGKNDVNSSGTKAPLTSEDNNLSIPADRLKQPAQEALTGKADTAPAPMAGSSGSSGVVDQSAKSSGNAQTKAQPNQEEGLALAAKSGCLVCHKIDTKLVGPAWRDVSKRYKGDAGAKARLIAKVKAGGKGNWTDVTGGIAMPPNSPKVSDENIEKLVTFVLAQ